MERINFTKSQNEIFFYFVNPKSGSHEGKILLTLGKEKFEFTENDDSGRNKQIYVYLVNITDSEILSRYHEMIKESINLYNEIKIIIAGGDGSVISIIKALMKKDINLTKLVFGVIPFGTGNDLSSALGFGSQLESNLDEDGLRTLTLNFISKSKKTSIDIWDLKLVLDDSEGEIIEYKGGMVPLLDDKGNKITEFRRSFINYFSLGYDANVGFSFNKNRSSIRCCNKFIYFWEGCKRNLCKRSINVNSFIKSFQIINVENNFCEENVTSMEDECKKDLLFAATEKESCIVIFYSYRREKPSKR